jgi:hypothetical protein
MQEETMAQEHFAGMLGWLKSKITSRLRDQTFESAGSAMPSEEIDLFAPTDSPVDIGVEHDVAAKRAAFSQHISC